MTRRTVFLLGLPGLAGCFRSSKPRLNVFTWSNYVAPETIPRFEREFGVEVRLGIYEINEEMLARVQSGNSGWDVVFPSNYFVGAMRDMGLLATLDHRRLPNISNLESKFQTPQWDLQLASCVPFMWGSSGIAVRADAPLQPRSWADLWSPLWRRRLTMLDDPVEVFGAMLAKLGLPLNSANPDHLRAAQKEAMSLKPLQRAYLNAEVRDQLVSGDVFGAHVWATIAAQADNPKTPVRYVYPQEGFYLYTDCLAILRETKRRELAHEFVNYMLRPEVAKEVVEVTFTATANGAARPLLKREVRDNPTLYPDEATLARGTWIEALPPDAQRLRDRLWTQLKSS